MKKTALSALSAVLLVSATLAPTNSAMAQYYDGHRPHWDRRGPPPPPPRWREERRHHHHSDKGAVIAGGLAAGVIGGLIGGAIANSGPRYVEPPPPPPRCWFEDRRVPNAYDGGWHMESIRVCQ
jgi:hypothetical protein